MEHKVSTLDKVKKIISQHLVESLILITLILIGLFYRSYNTLWGPEILRLSGDDFYHIFAWSDVKGMNFINPVEVVQDLVHTFFNSYNDAHPPLRNILVNLILRVGNDPIQSRLVSTIPGILLIPSFYYLGYLMVPDQHSSKVKIYNGLALASIITFMQQMIVLSFETRPYMLMMLFCTLSIITTLKFIKTKSSIYLYSFFATALLTLFSNYSASIFIAVCASLIIFTALNDKDFRSFKNLLILFIGMAFIAYITGFQIYKLKSSSILEGFLNVNAAQGGYISENYIYGLDTIFQRFTHYFFIFFHNYDYELNKIAVQASAYLYFVGLFILLWRKSYQLFCLALVPFIFGISCGIFKLYPFAPNRHSLYLVTSALISYSAIFHLIICSKVKALKGFFLISLIGICVVFSSIDFKHLDIFTKNIDRGGTYGHNKVSEESKEKLIEEIKIIKSRNYFAIFDETSGFVFEQIILLDRLKEVMQGNKFDLRANHFMKGFYCRIEDMFREPILCHKFRHNRDILFDGFSAVSLTTYHSPKKHTTLINLLRDRGYNEIESPSTSINQEWVITTLRKPSL